jgi:hypothetical protein
MTRHENLLVVGKCCWLEQRAVIGRGNLPSALDGMQPLSLTALNAFRTVQAD